jgi:hypothetical protein
LYVVGFHWLGATRDGHEETSRLEDYSNGERIYLGDKNSYLGHGQHTYELNYSTNRQLGFFTDLVILISRFRFKRRRKWRRRLVIWQQPIRSVSAARSSNL